MWELPWMVMASGILVSALPCCPDHNEISYSNESLACHHNPGFNMSIHQWCIDFYTINKEHPELDEAVFEENENKTMFFDGVEWSQEYCTATLKVDPAVDNKENPFSDQSGQELAVICYPTLLEETVEGHIILYAILLLISCVFLLATLIVYIILPDLRDMQGKCVCCLVLSLLLGYLGMSYLKLPFTTPSLEHHSCVTGAFFTYYWMLSAFFWLNISSFNVWRNSVLAHVEIAESKLMKVYYIIGFGAPFLFFSFALVTHHLPGSYIQPRIGKVSCWFYGAFEQWIFFYGIMLILLILNIVYFISTAFYLWSNYRRPNPMPRIRSMRTKFCVYLKLFMIMGITWIFEILSSLANEPWFVTDILNCLQGLIIFLVMVIFRKRVWRGLAAINFCGEGRRLARCWERMEDEESENEPIENTQISI